MSCGSRVDEVWGGEEPKLFFVEVLKFVAGGRSKRGGPGSRPRMLWTEAKEIRKSRSGDVPPIDFKTRDSREGFQ